MTVGELYRDIGREIGDPANVKVPTWILLTWINRAIKDVVRRTDCLYDIKVLTGLYRIKVLDYTGLSGKKVTVTIDSTATDKTEGVDWTAATSNSTTATSLATALNGDNRRSGLCFDRRPGRGLCLYPWSGRDYRKHYQRCDHNRPYRIE